MNKQTISQIKLDAARLESAADRIRDLHDAYLNTKKDLEIAKLGLKVIATWASFNEPSSNIHTRAMDTLALISEANK